MEVAPPPAAPALPLPPSPEDAVLVAAPPPTAGAEAALCPVVPAAAPATQGVDDEWADWRGCVCGGGYFGQMVACDGGCDNWFHFECVGLTRLPRGEYVCAACQKNPPKKRAREDDPPPAPAKKADRARSEDERKNYAALADLVDRGRTLRVGPGGAAPPGHPCAGAAVLAPLPDEILKPLRALHTNIVNALRRGKLMQSWEGRGGRLRSRGFAFLPKSLASWDRKRLEDGGLTFHAAEKTGAAAASDEKANWKSCFALRDVDVGRNARKALKLLAERVRGVVEQKYKKYVDVSQLVALQPNLHNGATHLPPHLDFPLHDGFGVVIVTIQMRGDPASVALVRGDKEGDFETHENAEQGERCWSFRLSSGDAYVLSGDARNVVDHGVLCMDAGGRRSEDIATEPRESLNLRFGLHSPAFANKEIYRQFAPAPRPRPPPKEFRKGERASSRLAQ